MSLPLKLIKCVRSKCGFKHRVSVVKACLKRVHYTVLCVLRKLRYTLQQILCAPQVTVHVTTNIVCAPQVMVHVTTNITFLLCSAELLLLTLVCLLVRLHLSLHFLSNFADFADCLMVAVNEGLLFRHSLLCIVQLLSYVFVFQLLLLDFCFLQEYRDISNVVDSSSNVMVHGDTQEGK